jgi:hypothetical protein
MEHLKTYGIMAALGLVILALDKRGVFSFLGP